MWKFFKKLKLGRVRPRMASLDLYDTIQEYSRASFQAYVRMVRQNKKEDAETVIEFSKFLRWKPTAEELFEIVQRAFREVAKHHEGFTYKLDFSGVEESQDGEILRVRALVTFPNEF